MPQTHVFVIEDEEDIFELISYNLKKKGFQVSGSNSGELGVQEISKSNPDLLVLDLMLPGMDGLEVCKRLKEDRNFSHLPIIMVTAKGEENDIITGLEMGADDYLTKPFSPKVLIARIQSVLRRSQNMVEDQEPGHPEVRQWQELTIDTGRHEVQLKGEILELTITEFKVLYLLSNRPGRVFTRYQIVNAVRGDNYPVTERSVDVQIVGLRKKLKDYGALIETVRGVGYRFKDD